MQIPVISYKKLIEQDEYELTKMKTGVVNVGFLVIRDSSINRELITKLIAIYRKFFNQSASNKAELDMALTGSNRGWGRSGGEQVSHDANPDYKEVYDVGIELEESDPLREVTYYAPNIWPEDPEFREQVLLYYSAALDVSLKLLREIARVAELPFDFFDDKFDPPMALLRANYYPPRPKNAGQKDFGIAPHTDYGCLTLLAIDGTSGLEVQLSDGSWEPVNVEPGEFVINFGEMLEMWSGGKIKATMHRVVGDHQERISIPFFCNPSYETNVAPLGSGEFIKAGDYLSRRYDETYVHRQNAKK